MRAGTDGPRQLVSKHASAKPDDDRVSTQVVTAHNFSPFFSDPGRPLPCASLPPCSGEAG